MKVGFGFSSNMRRRRDPLLLEAVSLAAAVVILIVVVSSFVCDIRCRRTILNGACFVESQSGKKYGKV